MKTSTVKALKDDTDALTKACNNDKLSWRQSAAPTRTTRTPRQLVFRAQHKQMSRPRARSNLRTPTTAATAYPNGTTEISIFDPACRIRAETHPEEGEHATGRGASASATPST